MLGTLRTMRRAPLAVFVFVAWTEIVWVGRVRNVMATDDWTAGDLILPLFFVLLGLGVAAVIAAPTPPWVLVAAVRGAALVSTVVVGACGLHRRTRPPVGFQGGPRGARRHLHRPRRLGRSCECSG